MSGPKILIDTNVFIGLEDEKEVAPELAAMQQACGKHGVRIFVHEAALQDIRRDADVQRRAVSLSKVKKFETLKGVHQPSRDELCSRFGTINRRNDEVDVALLHALDLGVVDFLVTQDQGIHARARRASPPVSDRVLTVGDALNWLRATYEPQEVRLPLIQEVPAHAIPLTDEIFDSLRKGYPGFDKWWREKCVANHRPCWVVTIEGELAGLVVRKDESHAEAQTKNKAAKVLKVCTFKVKPQFRGEKLGEQLLKQVLWFAQKNRYDLTYVTTFSDQTVLIGLLDYFGFEMTGTNAVGELIYEKPLSTRKLEANDGVDLFQLARLNYPRFVARPPAEAFYVPIRGEYHDVLFPEMALRMQPDLFQAAGLTLAGAGPRTPGNTIRKVYLCRARTKALKPGHILVFYRSLSPSYVASQSITSIGIVEAVNEASNLDTLLRLTAKRSVYSTQQLNEILAASTEPVKVIDFLLVGHLEPVVPLTTLVSEGVFLPRPPQSICHLSPNQFKPSRRRMNFGFDV